MNKELLDYRELAEYLGLSPITLRKKVSEKEIPYTKVGGRVRFRRTDIDRWLEARTFRPSAEVS